MKKTIIEHTVLLYQLHTSMVCRPYLLVPLQGKVELEELNEVGELRKILREYPVSWNNDSLMHDQYNNYITSYAQRYETANSCTVCGGFEFIPCRKCGGSKNSTANKFTFEFRALRCTHCNVNGMEECPACEERRKKIEEELEKKMIETQILETRTDEVKKEESSEQSLAAKEGGIVNNHVTTNDDQYDKDEEEEIIKQERRMDKNVEMNEEVSHERDEGAEITEQEVVEVIEDEETRLGAASMDNKAVATEVSKECGVEERAVESDKEENLELNKYISELNDVQF